MTDDTAAIQKMLDAPECKLATLDKGYYAVSKTLQMVSGARFLIDPMQTRARGPLDAS